MSNLTLHPISRNGLFYGIVAFALFFAGQEAFPTLFMNQWSLSFWRFNAQGQALARPEVAHRRASTWLISDAIQAHTLGDIAALTDDLSFTTDPFARRVLGHLQSLQSDHQQAFATWQEAGDYRSLIDAAADFNQEGQDELTYVALRTAYAVAPEPGVTELANFLIGHDASTEAERILQEALDEHPYSFHRRDWLHIQGRILRDQQAWPEALAIVDQLMAIDPVEANLERGLLAYDRGEGVDAALTYFGRAANADRTQGAALYRGARLLQQEHRFTEADEWYLMALNAGLAAPQWYLDFAANARNTGDLPAAIERYREATHLFPTYAPAYSELAWTLHLADKSKAASEQMARALALVEHPSLEYHLRAAQIFEATSEQAEAAAQFTAALSLDPTNSQAQRGLARLNAKVPALR